MYTYITEFFNWVKTELQALRDEIRKLRDHPAIQAQSMPPSVPATPAPTPVAIEPPVPVVTSVFVPAPLVHNPNVPDFTLEQINQANPQPKP